MNSALRINPVQGFPNCLARLSGAGRVGSVLLAAAISACTPPAEPGLQRLFEAPEPEFIEVKHRGRWVGKHRLPIELSEDVDLPSNAQLLLPWTVTGDLPEGKPVKVDLTVTASQGDASRILLHRQVKVKNAAVWAEEELQLGNDSPGRWRLSIEFREHIPRGREPRLSSSQIAISPLLAWPGEVSNSSQPDVVLIAIDTLRADHLSPYGADRATPNIAALADSGTLFEQAFSAAPWTLPSFSSVFTSTYPWTHQVEQQMSAIPTGLTTLAELFSANGYQTIGLHGAGFVRPVFGFNRGFDEYSQVGGFKLLFPTRARDSLGRTTSAPLLFFFHTYDVHAPYNSAPDKYRDFYADPQHPDPHELEGSSLGWKEVEPLLPLSAADVEFLEDLYDGEIKYVDDELPRILALLDELRPGRPRIVVFFADHGDSFRRDRISHYSPPMVELVHVPLIISGPGIAVSKRVREVTQTMDLLPTLAELLNLDTTASSPNDGRSFARHLRTDAPPEDERSVAISHSRGLSTLRSQAWTLQLRGDSATLFDRHGDPEEQIDISDQHPELTSRLTAILKQTIASTTPQPTNDAVLDAATIVQLRTLGYVD